MARGIDTNPNNEPARVAASSVSTEPALFLHDHPASSYATKIRLALRLKHLNFEKATPKDLGSGFSNPLLQSANLRLEVPALEIFYANGEKFNIFDSKAILAYLEDAYPAVPLLPADPRERATARMLEEICDTCYEAINWGLAEVSWFKRAEGAEAERLHVQGRDQIAQIQAWLESHLTDGRQFFNGTTPGYADICVLPVLNRSALRDMGPAEGTALRAWFERISKIPEVAETLAEVKVAADGMSNAGPTIWTGGRKREYRDHRLEWMMKNGASGIVMKGLQDGNIRFGEWPKVNG